MDILKPALKKVALRLAIQQWISLVVTGLIYSAGAACVWLVIARLFPMLGDPAPVALALAGAGLLVTSVLAYLRRPNLVAAALAADDRLGLRERLTSSLQLAEREDPMVYALHEDARKHVGRLNLRRDFPFSLPHHLRWLSVPVLLFGLGYVFLPEFDLTNYKERQAQAVAKEKEALAYAEVIKEEVKRLEEVEAVETDGEVAKTAEIMNEIAEEVRRGEIDRKQAAARLLNKAEEVAAQAAKLQESRPIPKMASDAQQFGEAAEVAENIQNGDFAAASEKMDELKKKMESGGLSEEEKQKMASDLSKLAKSLSGQSDALSQQLASIAANMEAGDMQAAMEGMQNVQMSLEDLQSVMNQLKQLEMAQNCIGGACEGLGFGNIGKGAGLGAGQGLGAGFKAGVGGQWAQGQSGAQGGGMGGPGRGRGGQLGELPESGGKFNPSVLPGQMQEGPMLATVNELAKPDEEAEATVDLLPGQVTQVQQQAEQALAQEEIPAGSREFVRQYFGTFESTGDQQQQQQ